MFTNTLSVFSFSKKVYENDGNQVNCSCLLQFCHSTKSDDEELAHKSLGEEFSVHIHNLRDLVANVVNYPNIQQVPTS